MTKYDAIKVLKDHKICFEHDFGWNKQVLDALDVAIEILAADVAPVRHGKWELYNVIFDILKCTSCGSTINCNDYGEYYMHHLKYCPYCGAKMEEESE